MKVKTKYKDETNQTLNNQQPLSEMKVKTKYKDETNQTLNNQ